MAVRGCDRLPPSSRQVSRLASLSCSCWHASGTDETQTVSCVALRRLASRSTRVCRGLNPYPSVALKRQGQRQRPRAAPTCTKPRRKIPLDVDSGRATALPGVR